MKKAEISLLLGALSLAACQDSGKIEEKSTAAADEKVENEPSKDEEHEEDGDAASECRVQPEKLPAAQKIVSGKTAPAIYISEGQQMAVGALMSTYVGEWTNICTATVIAPKVVLTAAHCVLKDGGTSLEAEAPSAFKFAVGPDVGKEHQEFVVKEIKWNSAYGKEALSAADQAILLMEDDLTVAVPGLIPIEINADHDLDWMAFNNDLTTCDSVQNVGYGATEKNGKNQKNTKRYWTMEPVLDMYKTHFTVDGGKYTGVGPGDSGGPALYRFPDGVLRIVGTVSHGDDSCIEVDEYSRIDDNLSFVTKAAGKKIYGCLELTAAGACTNNDTVARWCTDASRDIIDYQDCAANNQVCAIGADGVAACVAKTAPEPPECALDAAGRCDGAVAEWCENDHLMRRDCGKCGQNCGLTDNLGYYCLN